MSDFVSLQNNVICELKKTLQNINSNEVEELVELIINSKKVFTIGVGRVDLSLRAFCKRLNHVGILAYPVGAINEPKYLPNDLLIVASRSGKTIIPLNIALKAKALGGKLAYVGSSMKGFLPENADVKVVIPSFGLNVQDPEFKSHQLMASLFEQTMLVLGDIVCSLIVTKKNLDIQKINDSHANLE